MYIDKIKRKVKKRSLLLTGLVILFVAIILAFSAIHVVEAEFESEDRVLEGKGQEDYKILESRYQALNSSIEMEFHPENQDDTTGGQYVIVTVIYADDEQENISVGYDEVKTIELDDNANIILSDFDSEEGNLTFKQTIVYERQPYSLLSIPAFLLTIVGLVVVYNGKYRMKVDKQMKEKEKVVDENDDGKESSPEPKFMGVDWGKKD